MNNNIRNITLLILFLLYVNNSYGQSCLPDGITFNSQVQIDSFSYNYPGCKEIEGDVTITGGDISNLQGLNEITKMNGFLGILNADSLITLQGLNNLCEIGGQLWIGYYGPDGNMSLESFSGLEGLKTINQGLTVIQNPKIENFLGLDSLRYVFNLEIGTNEKLNSLIGLYSLDTIDYGLTIAGTESLKNLNGLSNLSFVNHYIEIKFNDSLTNLYGLDSLNENSIDYILQIYNNPRLSQCDAISLCEFLADTMSNSTIQNNNIGCNSPDEVLESCINTIPVNNYSDSNIFLFPNPTSRIVNIDHDKDVNIYDIKIFDTRGQLRLNPIIENSKIDISILNPGLYVVEFKTSSNVIRKKIIKH